MYPQMALETAVYVAEGRHTLNTQKSDMEQELEGLEFPKEDRIRTKTYLKMEQCIKVKRPFMQDVEF
jgi:hypothetical protein